MNRGFFSSSKKLYVLPRINTDYNAKQNVLSYNSKWNVNIFTIDIDFVTLYCDKITKIVSCKLSIYIGAVDWSANADIITAILLIKKKLEFDQSNVF